MAERPAGPFAELDAALSALARELARAWRLDRIVAWLNRRLEAVPGIPLVFDAIDRFLFATVFRPFRRWLRR